MSRLLNRLVKRRRGLGVCVLGVALALGLTEGAAAQALPDGSVTATGLATVKHKPEVLRVQVQLSGEGKTLKDALAQLKKRQESASKKLAGLGAVASSIAFEEPQAAGAGGDSRQRQMEQMMRARMRGGARAATGPAAGAPMTRVTLALKAEWALSAKSSEDRLLEAEQLEAKIKAADFSEAKVASLEEQERREELAAMGGGEEGGAAPGEPAFVYVCKIPAEDRLKATAEAFKKAKAQATELAKASASELGALKQLQSQSGTDYEQMMEMRRYRSMGMAPPVAAEEDEVAGGDATGVTLRISVTASFAIKAKAE